MKVRHCTLAAVLAIGVVGCGPKPPSNLIIISLDTVRRDHLSTYGYERPTSPVLDTLAEQGVLFDDAFTQATNTAPAHASLFTGLYPHAHGLTRNGYPMARSGPPTLAELLRAEGFRTAGFISGYTLESEISGLDRGFEIYDDDFDGNKRDGAATLDRALEWLADLPLDDRFFLFLHLFDASGPYLPPSEYLKIFESVEPGPSVRHIARYQRQLDEQGERISHANFYVDRYDSLIRYENDLLQALLDRVDPTNTIVIVTADHGETLAERHHAFDHGGRVFDEQIRIPLILVAPGLEAGMVEGSVETIDLLPTILELLGISPPDSLQIEGRSLSPLIEGSAPGRELVYSTAQAARWRFGDRGYRLDSNRLVKAVRSDCWKLIRYPGREGDYLELYDLRRDPEERSNVADQFPAERDRLLDQLKSWEGGWTTGVPPSEQLDPEVAERLRALGYLGD